MPASDRLGMVNEIGKVLGGLTSKLVLGEARFAMFRVNQSIFLIEMENVVVLKLGGCVRGERGVRGIRGGG